MEVLLGAYVVNIVTFAFTNLFAWRWTKGADLETARCGSRVEPVNYLIAGMRNRPSLAYEFIMDVLSGGIVYVNFRQTGWSAEVMADAILADIREHSIQKVRVWTISVSDQVGRYLDAALTNSQVELEIIAINPCLTPRHLNSFLSSVIRIAPALQIIKYALGWLSVIPVIPPPAFGTWHSVSLAFDQLLHLSCNSVPMTAMSTIGLVLSAHDEFANNEHLERDFYGLRPEYVDTSHANTGVRAGKETDYGELYREKVLEILQYSKF